MTEQIKLSATFNTSAKNLYSAWLDSKKHSAFTGAKAKISEKQGGNFTALDGYIEGKNIELIPNKK